MESGGEEEEEKTFVFFFCSFFLSFFLSSFVSLLILRDGARSSTRKLRKPRKETTDTRC